MKTVIALCLIGSVFAELPRLRPARFRSQRQELAPTTDAATEATTESGYPPSGWKPNQAFTLPDQTDATTDSSDPTPPYPPSGWKPAGQAFTLPQETTAMPDAPDSTYGPPENTYGPPAPYPPSGWKPAGQPFALPDNSYGQPDNSYGPPENTYGPPTANTEKLDGPIEVQKSLELYYVLLPNGELQRVDFLTENDFQNMKYTARLELRDRAPLYIFGP